MAGLAVRAAAWGTRLRLRALGWLLDDGGQLAMMHDLLGYVPNVSVPRSFNEKVMRRKLSPHPPIWSVLADKVRVRDYVSHLVGPEILNELYLVTDDPAEIRLDRLPDQFAVKANHGSHWNTIVDDATRVCEDELRATCRTWLGLRYGRDTREHWYDAIPPRITVERFLSDERRPPLEYKVWVFHGRAKFVQVSDRRFDRSTQTVYDRRWRRQRWRLIHRKGPDHPRPDRLDDMLSIAERLAGDIDFVRVDLYCIGGRRVVFGELTLAPAGGHRPFVPDPKYDFLVGALW